jgi:branched-chain amino acid transport system permease protein
METFVQLLLIGINNGGVLALNAMAVTVIYCAVRTLNLAHGDVYALSSVVSMIALRNLIPGDGSSASIGLILLVVPVTFVITVLFAMIVNGLVEFLGFRLFRGQSRLSPIIATLGLSYMLYQLALVWRQLLPNFTRGEHRSDPGRVAAHRPRQVAGPALRHPVRCA